MRINYFPWLSHMWWLWSNRQKKLLPTPTKYTSSFNLVNFKVCLHSYQLHCNKFVILVYSLVVWLFCNTMHCRPAGSPVHGFSRQEYLSRLPCPFPGDLSNPGIKPSSPALQVDSLPLSHMGSMCKLPTPNLKYLTCLWVENQSMSYSSQKAAVKMIS